ncbi:hypothetical protein [Enterococcus wangshanyuanii]|uniref:Phage protein n=1 Tax=Enterococcus wangshanyuanii TaxID=2005703 RepID=A0ABQ1PVH7_9ENTE|nr:hypothetical protein [Enterococcus wangshanyuanii]GGD04346.1 hypothetical protein GCM10011573_37370 [Enterococcus wangshanyuanii]
MTEYKTSEAKRRANKKYDQNNPEGRQYRNKKSAAKSFINIATDEDFLFIQELVKERLERDNTKK